ncbi:hypothetical protein HUE87_09515 [Candidatus Sulfurimonas marisnigri]|uniref:Uncharacterized protein n=1 Tax=Candidatus Sulfurimonas marisnigri TaxID=2740405 RepID=A0A7S7LZ49_9BACT|nr:hypothetical protein [Candidatus Sulfurimonas marisnigri]QOY54114.1 hypothetical protein HUE87_09515 [Candidatus Sulfurimonas marisnigri]
MKQTLTDKEYVKAREAIMVNVRKVVPYALMIAVASGLYMITQVLGKIEDSGMTYFQILLSIKAFFASWLGVRGVNQKLFNINPWVFKSHLFPFSLVVVVILISQLMYI